MNGNVLVLPILVPLAAAALAVVAGRIHRRLPELVMLAAAALNLAIAVILFRKDAVFSLPWLGFGVDWSLRLLPLSNFVLAATAGFGVLIALYSSVFLRVERYAGKFHAYLLLSLSFTSGAVLADNLVLMLFFWEGLLVPLFGMISCRGKGSFSTAIKALVIVGVSDFCMMVGIALAGHCAGTLSISAMHIELSPLAAAAFVLLLIGTLAKAGSMPFHTWIPDASIDAPLPFMAFMPAALEKLLGIYFLARISLDIFALDPHSGLSMLMMTVGALTILGAVMMALVQKNYKKLLSYHAISQVGYMVLGIGTGLPVGIAGGLFHMINHAMYKSCLFLTAGSVQRQAGTTELQDLGGLRRAMPLTFGCFLIAAASISGVPPFNGFFSKELVYDAALQRGMVFYIAAVTGSFLTAASFLKLGHAAFFGKIPQRGDAVREAPWQMTLPMGLIALGCVVFGVFNALPLDLFIKPSLGSRLGEHHIGGMPSNILLVVVTLIVIAAAVVHHLLGAKAHGSGLKAVDHIHHAPVLGAVYEGAERRIFDPYEIGMKLTLGLSRVIYWCDRVVDGIYGRLLPAVAQGAGALLRRMHSGSYALYMGWALIGMAAMAVFLVWGK